MEAYGFNRNGVHYSMKFGKEEKEFYKNGKRITELEFERAEHWKKADGTPMEK